MSAPILQINNLSKTYKSRNKEVHAISNINLSLFKGEIRPSWRQWRGKTTLSSIIATLHPPTSGDILFNGQSIYQELMTYRRSLGFCRSNKISINI